MSRSERGSLMLWSLMISIVLLLFVVSGIPFFHTVVTVPGQSYLRDQALALAEVGVEEAKWELNDAPDPPFDGARGWTDQSGEPFCVDTDNVDPGSPVCSRKTITQLQAEDGSGTIMGDIEVTVIDWVGRNPRVLSTGFVPSQAEATDLSERTLQVGLQKQKGLFRYSLFGDDMVDIYNPPGPVQVRSCDWEIDGCTTDLMRGDVGSNDNPVDATADIRLWAGPDTDVWGLLYLPDVLTAFVQAWFVVVVPTTVPTRQDPQELPGVVIPQQFLPWPACQPVCAADWGMWSRGGPGTDCYGGSPSPGFCVGAGEFRKYSYVQLNNSSCSGNPSGSTFVMEPNSAIYLYGDNTTSPAVRVRCAQFIAKGNNRIYIEDSTLTTTGTSQPLNGLVNVTGDPADVRIYILSPTNVTSVVGQNDFSGVIYAPHSTLEFRDDGGGWSMNPSYNFKGSFIAKKVSFNGVRTEPYTIRHDAALGYNDTLNAEVPLSEPPRFVTSFWGPEQ